MQLTIAHADYREGASIIAIPAGYDPAKLWLLVNGQVWTPQNFTVVGGQIIIAGDDLSSASIQIAQPIAQVTPDLADLTAKLNALLADKQTKALLTVTATPSRPVVSAEPTNLALLAGMDNRTGKRISGMDYLRQRITNTLTTPQGTQVLLRARGSNLQDLIDMPINPMGIATWITEIAHALSHPLAGLPDFVLGRVKIVTASGRGDLGLQLTGDWLGKEVEVAV